MAVEIANATFAARHQAIWGTGSTAAYVSEDAHRVTQRLFPGVVHALSTASPDDTNEITHGEHPGARVSVAQTLIGGACQQPRFAESDARHSRRMMRSTLPGTDVYARDLDTSAPRARRCRFNTLTSTDGPITRLVATRCITISGAASMVVRGLPWPVD